METSWVQGSLQLERMSSLTAVLASPFPEAALPLSLPIPTPYKDTGLWEVAWETWCASFPGSSAGFLCLLADVQQAGLLEQGFQLTPRAHDVGRAETSVVKSCFRSHLCV